MVHLQVSDKDLVQSQDEAGSGSPKGELRRGDFKDRVRGLDFMDFGDVANHGGKRRAGDGPCRERLWRQKPKRAKTRLRPPEVYPVC
jgi:hypothetical protein